ncbi:MAG: autotransporter domain-containing protein [Deltaproteobacteria bacterium]|nr:autotransporter domain-containing protein [Deltaproteobacteria bacterium]
MKTGTLSAATIMVSCAGLFVLAVFSDINPALAQTREACPLPAGVTAPADPPVTAQQVEDGSGGLMEFALAVTAELGNQNDSADLGRFLHFACLMRQEGGPWRSGSTYVVTLSLDGRLFLHAKDTALTGRQLNPLIYGAILSALGVPQEVLADLASADLVMAVRARAVLVGILSRGPEAPFDATSVVPGASGHASAYVSAPYGGLPFVALAGFELDSSHLAPLAVEQIDYGDPAVTARDVVDRETLKAFVTEAGNYVTGHLKSGDPSASAKAFIALRDPNGPWRHGSVYLYILDRTIDAILFHGAFPNRFELRPLTPTVRDAVTGELILPQVFDAAKNNPEGGFVEYYFDDPSDDTDSADTPKVGYARAFNDEVVTARGRRPINIIVGSGFYQSSPNVVAARRNTAVKSVVPQVMRAMTASTVDAVSGRIRRATSDIPPAKGFRLGGASKFSDVLLTNARALEGGTFNLGRLLAGSSFTVPLYAAGTGRGGLFGNLTFWGGGDYRNFSGGSAATVDYDGNVASANLGVDTRLSEDFLAGVSLAWARGAVEYTASGVTGDSETTLTSVNPYVGWQSSAGMNLWATGGYGWGEVEIDESGDTQASDLTQRMVAAGVSGPLVSSDELIGGGTTSLRLKGETMFSWADIEGSGSLEQTTLSASRQRLMLEGVHERKLASGATFTPSIEVGMRYDGGDGDTGSSVETGGGLRFTDAASGLTVEGRARTLFAHSEDYEEWGVSGLLRLDPGEAGLGFAASLRPAWGRTGGGVKRLWNTGVAGPVADDQTGRVHARVAYGFGTTWGGRGVLTPYTDVSLSGAGSRRLSLGGQFKAGSWVTLSLEGVHNDQPHGADSQGVMLSANMIW